MLVESSFTDLETPNGPMRVHVHAPSGSSASARFARFPALALYSEIYQQTAPIRRSALRFASAGYIVAVPEVYHQHEPPGTVLAYDTEGTDKGNLYKYATALSTYDHDAKIVVDFLRAHPRGNGAVGAVGWCLGGHLAFRAALLPEVRATACFYPTDLHGDTLGAGKASDSKVRAREIQGELMMVFGRQDPHVPDEGRRDIYAMLTAAKLRFSWHEFNAVHAFMRDEGPRYDAALASLGYALALDMFEKTLK